VTNVLQARLLRLSLSGVNWEHGIVPKTLNKAHSMRSKFTRDTKVSINACPSDKVCTNGGAVHLLEELKSELGCAMTTLLLLACLRHKRTASC
jgi:hypothetical protein